MHKDNKNKINQVFVIGDSINYDWKIFLDSKKKLVIKE